jgi:hypothetical protein
MAALKREQRLALAASSLIRSVRALVVELLIAILILMRWLVELVRLTVRLLKWLFKVAWRFLASMFAIACAGWAFLLLHLSYGADWWACLPALMIVSVPALIWASNKVYRKPALLLVVGLLELLLAYGVPALIPALRVILIVVIMVGARLYLERTFHGSATTDDRQREVSNFGPIDARG